jgi:signal transduction histidine kinase
VRNSPLPAFLQSIRFRLTLWFVLILSIVLAIFSVYIYYVQARNLQADEISHIQDKFARIQAFFQNPDWESSNLSPSNVPGSSAPLQSSDLLTLLDPTAQVLQNWGITVANPNGVFGGLVSAVGRNRALYIYEQTISVPGASGQKADLDYLFIITPVLHGDNVVGFLVIGSPSNLASQLHRLLISLILGSLGMLLIAFLGGLWLADRAMRPVQAITQTARTISESDLSRRINLRGRDELAQLGATFDEMLSRLQAAFDRQRRFVADASHELRTPLTIINLEVGRLVTGSRTAAEYQHALKVVQAEGERMSRLVNDLMTLARMDAGQTILQSDTVDLSDIAVEAVERMLPLAQARQVALDVGALPELNIRGDRQYLIQLVSNLIENAIKYGGGDQKVRVETGCEDHEKIKLAYVRVSDTGPGIPTDHLPRIFDRFYRVDEARSPDSGEGPGSPGGSGLGLSIVAWIARAHGGEIIVESKVDHGTVFEARLPLLKSVT